MRAPACRTGAEGEEMTSLDERIAALFRKDCRVARATAELAEGQAGISERLRQSDTHNKRPPEGGLTGLA
jgi:hypothetical protein